MLLADADTCARTGGDFGSTAGAMLFGAVATDVSFGFLTVPAATLGGWLGGLGGAAVGGWLGGKAADMFDQ